jgi:hypothetical protein
LANGKCASPADLARKLAVSRARVPQVLRLLKLAPEVLETFIALRDALALPIVIERRIRPIVDLSAEEQKQKIDTTLQDNRAEQF